MKDPDFYVLIVYPDDSSELKQAAQVFFEAADEHAKEVRVKAASDVLIPDILACDVLVFGAGSGSPAQSGYSEIQRVFRGINLRRRVAGLVYPGSDGEEGTENSQDSNAFQTCSFLSKMCEGTGLAQPLDCFAWNDEQSEKARVWMNDLIKEWERSREESIRS
ncbi:MAG: hypothetical protein K9L29_09350 [Spirochaetales bacterium]|nr:hypothetical protein [Spirochaetales bacterium]